MDTYENLTKTVEGLDRIRQRRDAELHRLLQGPSLFNVAEQLVDILADELTYLCNFHHIVSHSGHVTPILELIQHLEHSLRERFKLLTGKDYQPEVVRGRDYKRAARRLSPSGDR